MLPRPQPAPLFVQRRRQPRNFSWPEGQATANNVRGRGGPNIPRRQRRTLPAGVRAQDHSSHVSTPEALPKRTSLSSHQACSPRCVTAQARSLLPWCRPSPMAHAAPGAAHPRGGEGSPTWGSIRSPVRPEPAAGHSGSPGPQPSLGLAAGKHRAAQQRPASGWLRGWTRRQLGARAAASAAESQPSHSDPQGTQARTGFTSEAPSPALVASRRAGSTSLCPSPKHRQPLAPQGRLRRRTTCPARAQSPKAQARANSPRDAGDQRHPQAVPQGMSPSLSTSMWVPRCERWKGAAVTLRQRTPRMLQGCRGAERTARALQRNRRQGTLLLALVIWTRYRSAS